MFYTIEQKGQDGRWFVRGSARYEHDARYHAERYARADKVEMRVRNAAFPYAQVAVYGARPNPGDAMLAFERAQRGY